MDNTEFKAYPKTPRLFRDIVITEKLDGTNAQVCVERQEWVKELAKAGNDVSMFFCGNGEYALAAGSRNRWLTPANDNYGFARWVASNIEDLIKLGEGRHFGEWWGNGIQRGYDLKEKRFSLFNVARWRDGAVTKGRMERNVLVGAGEPLSPRPACCSIVPILYEGPFSTLVVHECVHNLADKGSVAAPGFDHPEGVITFHTASNSVFKTLIEADESAKGE